MPWDFTSRRHLELPTSEKKSRLVAARTGKREKGGGEMAATSSEEGQGEPDFPNFFSTTIPFYNSPFSVSTQL